MRRGFVWIWAAMTAVVAGLAGFFSYQAGWAAGLATKLPADGVAPPYYYYGPHLFWFFPFLPLLFLFLILFFVFRAGRRGWGGGHPGWRMEERLQQWHRQAHGDQPPAGGQQAG